MTHGEEIVMGGDPAAAIRLVEEHNRRAAELRAERNKEAAQAAGSASLNGAAMDPREAEYMPKEPTDSPRFIVDII